jgi:hypothetical protein
VQTVDLSNVSLDHWTTGLAAAVGTLASAAWLLTKMWYQAKALRLASDQEAAKARRQQEIDDARAEVEIAKAEAEAEAIREARHSTPDIKTGTTVVDGDGNKSG